MMMMTMVFRYNRGGLVGVQVNNIQYIIVILIIFIHPIIRPRFYSLNFKYLLAPFFYSSLKKYIHINNNYKSLTLTIDVWFVPC